MGGAVLRLVAHLPAAHDLETPVSDGGASFLLLPPPTTLHSGRDACPARRLMSLRRPPEASRSIKII